MTVHHHTCDWCGEREDDDRALHSSPTGMSHICEECVVTLLWKGEGIAVARAEKAEVQ